MVWFRKAGCTLFPCPTPLPLFSSFHDVKMANSRPCNGGVGQGKSVLVRPVCRIVSAERVLRIRYFSSNTAIHRWAGSALFSGRLADKGPCPTPNARNTMGYMDIGEYDNWTIYPSVDSYATTPFANGVSFPPGNYTLLTTGSYKLLCPVHRLCQLGQCRQQSRQYVRILP